MFLFFLILHFAIILENIPLKLIKQDCQKWKQEIKQCLNGFFSFENLFFALVLAKLSIMFIN